MKKIAVFAFILAFALNACGAIPGLQQPLGQPTVDTQASAVVEASTISAKTLAALSTPTTVAPTETQTPVLLPSPIATDTEAIAPIIESTQTAIIATSTNIPVNPTITASTTATQTSPSTGGLRTATPTLGILVFGTLPPKVPSSPVLVLNKSKAQAYISLQCTTRDNKKTILEYPVRRSVNIDTPNGYCIYVAWVGGKKLSGSFYNTGVTITLFSDHTTVK